MGENLEQILKIIKDSKVVVASSHQKTDDDALFSVIFFKKYIEILYPDKQCFALVDTEEQLSDDITNILGKYKQLGMQAVTAILPAAPDLFLALDSQIGRPDMLIPTIKNGEDIIKLELGPLKKICLDHHKLIEGVEYNFTLIDSLKYSSTTSLIMALFEGDLKTVKTILNNEGSQILSSIGYEGIYQDTGGMKKEIMTQADHKAAQFLSKFMDHAKLHRLHNKKKNPLTRKMLGEALSKESFDKIGNIANYVFLSRQINTTDESKIAEVANGILGCEESQNLGVVVAGIVHDREADQYSLRLKIRSDNPKIIPANEIAKMLSHKSGGDKFKAAAVIDLNIFKYSTSSPAFQELIKEEVQDRLLGSELNAAAEKPSKQSLTKPTPLEKLLSSNRESEQLLELHRKALNSMVFRSQKKFVSHFVEKGLTEDDVSALININNLYYGLMGRGELKKTQASFIYGLVSEGFEPYLVGIISVKHDEKQSELGSAEDFAKKLFGSNIVETALPGNSENSDSVAFRVPIPYMEYRTNFTKLFECLNHEISERERILGEKADSEEKIKEAEAE